MMEGEPATPGIVRVADEETAFVGRRVEAPRRHLKQQQRAQKKRLAVLAASAVTVVAFGTVCAFLTIPSESTGEVKTAVSQAMESDPATANADQVFVPSFAVYDEDGDGKVSLGEYLDRLSVNRDAALEKVQASSLDDSEKARIADLLNDDFDQHLECVVHLAQEHNDDVVMTKENFDRIYKGITVEFCPMDDDRIPDSYQSKEIAAGQEELAPIAADPDTESSDLWDPASSTSTSESYSGSQSSYESESNSRNSSAAGGEKDDSSPSDSEKRWTPTEPTNPPKPEADELNHENANEPKTGKQWRPDLPTSPPVSSDNDVALPHTVSSDNIGWNSEAAAQKYPTATATAPNGEKATGAYNSYKGAATTGAYNAYRGANTGAYNSYTGAVTTGSANTGAYNAYTGANTGAYNSYTGAVTTGSANTGAYNAYTGANTGAYNSYTGAATTGSANTGAYNAYTGANTGAYNAYTAAATTDAYNAYKGADTTTTAKVIDSFGATGQFGIQIAKAFGAEVITTASPRNIELVKSLGADQVIDYTSEKWGDVLAEHSVDVIYDCAVESESWSSDAQKVLKKNTGKFLTIGIVQDQAESPIGATLIQYYCHPIAEDLEGLQKLVQAGQLKTVIDSVYPFDKLLDAIKQQMSGKTQGKVIIEVAKE
uniref:EF-hand domain-containing protein n=1 Tax=Phytophthora ramorum TaxID=164328 RepID=H3H710_PHYRM